MIRFRFCIFFVGCEVCPSQNIMFKRHMMLVYPITNDANLVMLSGDDHLIKGCLLIYLLSNYYFSFVINKQRGRYFETL